VRAAANPENLFRSLTFDVNRVLIAVAAKLLQAERVALAEALGALVVASTAY
jgi:hypothetical protein